MPHERLGKYLNSDYCNKPSLSVIVITAQLELELLTALNRVAALLEKPLNFPLLLRTVSDLLAESPRERRARIQGKPADFHYIYGRKE